MTKMGRRHDGFGCGTSDHWQRRTLLKAAGLSGLAWLTPVARALAQQDQLAQRRGRPAQSVILLWMSGGPSQLETFDPHAGKSIGGDATAIKTKTPGIELAGGLARLAEQMDEVSLVRNVVSREGDHERAAYNVKTGFRPDPTLEHPSLGAVLCHQLPVGQVEIPRHISILPDQWHGQGGHLGAEFDAFRVPATGKGPMNVTKTVDADRFDQRLSDLSFVDQQFAARRRGGPSASRPNRSLVSRAVEMMTSDQLKAFDLSAEPVTTRADFGGSDFGDACLTALRLIEEGVRCVEVTLDGWDTHINNHELQSRLVSQLDPAFAALIKHLKLRDRLQDTIVVCGGEFGRTPNLNPAAGRDHWPHGFSLALAGGNLRRGFALGETDPEGGKVAYDDGTPIENVHATLLSALNINPTIELDTPVGRPIKLSEGTTIRELLG
jgi:hypothetical protein